MPRPRKEDKRTERLAFRLTPEERMDIERSAAQAGLSASEYARMQVLRGRVIVRESRSLSPALFDELRRIGVNLNQLAHHANAGRFRGEEVSRVCLLIERFLVRELEHGP